MTFLLLLLLFQFSHINAVSLFSFSGSWSEDLIYCFALDRQIETVVLQTSVC